MARKLTLLALLALLALLLAFWAFGPVRSVATSPESASASITPEVAPGTLTTVEPASGAREEATWSLDLPETAAPAGAPFGIQPVEFVLSVRGGNQPIRGAEVRYGPHQGVTDQAGDFRWPSFINNANLEIRSGSYVRFSGWANKPRMQVQLLKDCRIEIRVVSGGVPAPNLEMTALAAGGFFDGRLFKLEDYVMARGKTDAEGWFRANADHVQMAEDGSGYVEIEIQSGDGRPPWVFNVHRSEPGQQRDPDRWFFQATLDLSQLPAGIRLYAEWLNGQSAAPAADCAFSWRPSGAETSLWREGIFDSYGFAELSSSFEKGGEITLRTPGGRSWSSAGSAVEWRDAQNLLLRVQDRQATVRCTGAALPKGVRLQACQVAFTDEGRGWGRQREVHRSGLKWRTDWTDLTFDEPVALHGGWTGDRIGVVIRALPGGIPLEIAECEANGMAVVRLPELGVLEVDGAHLPASWASTSCWLLPAEYAGQKLAGPFYLASGRMALILPHGQYRIRVTGLDSPAEFPVQVDSPWQRVVLPWK